MNRFRRISAAARQRPVFDLRMPLLLKPGAAIPEPVEPEISTRGLCLPAYATTFHKVDEFTAKQASPLGALLGGTVLKHPHRLSQVFLVSNSGQTSGSKACNDSGKDSVWQ